MAYAKHLQSSGDGDQVGLDSLNLTESFYVELDEEEDDPIDVVQDRITVDAYGRTGVPLRQSHPDPKYAVAVVRNYSRYHLGDLSRIVVVHYSPPTIPPIQATLVPGWRFATHTIGRTRRIIRDLDQKTIGGRATKYEKPPTSPLYKAVSPISNAEIDVKLAGDDFTSPVGNVGMEIDDGIFAFTLSRVTLSMTTAKLRSAKSSLFKCNAASWFGYEKKTVLIADVNIQEVEYHNPTSGYSNRRNQYPVSVELWQADKDWTQEVIPIFYEEEGKTSPVYIIGDGNAKVPAGTTYRVRSTIDLPGFLSQFEGSSP